MNGQEWKEKVEEACKELSNTASEARGTLNDVLAELEWLKEDFENDGEPDEDEVTEIGEFIEMVISACDDAIVEVDDLMGELEEEV